MINDKLAEIAKKLPITSMSHVRLNAAMRWGISERY